MAKKRTYRTVSVHQLDAGKLAASVGTRCIVAIDVAKVKMMAGFATAAGQCAEIVRFEHPTQTRMFLALLSALRELGVALEVVLESTGVYGDSLRHQLTLSGISVFRMDTKKVHDAAELLDGVASMHDAKACTILAHLHAQGLSKPWRERSELQRTLRSMIDLRDLYARPFQVACGRLEAVVARHWPELSEHIDTDAGWHLHLLSELGGPARVSANPTATADLLRRVSRGALSESRIQQIIGLAAGSLGDPMSAHELELVQAVTRHLLELRAQIRAVDERIEAEIEGRPELQHLRAVLGAVTTAALVADAGNPADYESAAAFEKALGLNLKIRSSGEDKGIRTLRITKRGPSRARRYLYLAALRLINRDGAVRQWYRARKGYLGDMKLKAVVAVMRKLARAMVHVARGAPFDASKLFDTRRLAAPAATPSLAAS